MMGQSETAATARTNAAEMLAEAQRTRKRMRGALKSNQTD
jgi:hypothetical protein